MSEACAHDWRLWNSAIESCSKCGVQKLLPVGTEVRIKDDPDRWWRVWTVMTAGAEIQYKLYPMSLADLRLPARWVEPNQVIETRLE